MRLFILLLTLSNSLFAQIYGNPQSNRGPDHGLAKNFSTSKWSGISSVGSELIVNGQTYSYIRSSLDNFKLSLRTNDKFKDIIPNLKSKYFDAGMSEYSRLLHIYEDEKIINIYSWGVDGYHFVFYEKREHQESRLVRYGFIKNAVHSMEGFDGSIKAIEFTGADQMRISKDPGTEAEKKLRPYLFTAVGDYEFRTDGVYLNGNFDPSVQDREPQDVIDENIQRDPQHYLKKKELHAERVASWNKDLMDEEAARIAALAPQPTPKQSAKPTPPEPNPEPAVAPSPIPKTPAATTEPESTLNFTPWLAGLVALLVMLLGYLAVRYIRRRS